MDKRDGLDAAKKLVRRGGERVAPSVGPIVPEVRTPVKWKPTLQNVPPQFRPEAFVLVVWNFGVPFKDTEGLNTWLASNEIELAGLCDNKTDGKVAYLGTYLNVYSEGSRYQTFWGLKADNGQSTDPAELALTNALATPGTFQDLVAQLRSYWVRDANATDQRYGLARHYINFNTVPDEGFWGVTRKAVTVPPIP